MSRGNAPRQQMGVNRGLICVGETIRIYIGVLRPMCCARFRPVCVEGRCPYFDILPLQGANVIKPSRGGGPRVSFTPFTIPWAEIPLPLQGAAVSKPPNNYGALGFLNRAPRFQNLRIMNGSCVFKTSMFCHRVAPFNRQFYAMFRWFWTRGAL